MSWKTFTPFSFLVFAGSKFLKEIPEPSCGSLVFLIADVFMLPPVSCKDKIILFSIFRDFSVELKTVLVSGWFSFQKCACRTEGWVFDFFQNSRRERMPGTFLAAPPFWVRYSPACIACVTRSVCLSVLFCFVFTFKPFSGKCSTERRTNEHGHRIWKWRIELGLCSYFFKMLKLKANLIPFYGSASPSL